MKKLYPLLTLSTIIISVLSCNKDKIEPIEDQIPAPIVGYTPTHSIGDFFTNNLNSATQQFRIDASQNEVVTGLNGTVLNIDAGSFSYQGNPVSGMVDLELIEVLTKPDMILLRKTTTSSGNLLESGGEIYLAATQNGNQLQLSATGNIAVSIPTINPDPSLELFEGSVISSGDVNWTNLPGSTVSADSVFSLLNFDINAALNPNNGYIYWVNGDAFLTGIQNRTTVNITLSSGFDYTNTAVFLYFDNRPIVSSTAYYDPPGQFQSFTGVIPIGDQIKIVAVAVVNDQYYSSITPISVSPGHTEPIQLNQTTEAQVITDIRGL